MGLDKHDWSRWAKGLIGACISGTSGSLGAGASTMYVVPEKVNLGEGLSNLIYIVLSTAVIAFFTSFFKYLQQNPLPKDDDEEKKP